MVSVLPRKQKQAVEKIESDTTLNPLGLSAKEWLSKQRQKWNGQGAAEIIGKMLSISARTVYCLFENLNVCRPGRPRKEKPFVLGKDYKPIEPEPMRKTKVKEQEEIRTLLNRTRKGSAAARRQLWEKSEERVEHIVCQKGGA